MAKKHSWSQEGRGLVIAVRALFANDLDDLVTDVYVHNFTLYYIIKNNVTSLPGPQTTAVFTFGTIPTHHTIIAHDSSFHR